MSIALLTVSLSSPSPLEQAINSCCASQLELTVESSSRGKRRKSESNLIKIGQLEVYHLLTIPASHEEPYKILFFRHAKQDIVRDYDE